MMLFICWYGNKFNQKDIDTFEKLFNIILNNEQFKYTLDATEILHQCAKSIKENDKLVFPFELENFI